MKTSRIKYAGLLLSAALAVVMSARSIGPPVMRTGAQVDGGITCTACHLGSTANSDPRGKLTVLANEYKPGVKQTIRVIFEHPEALRWGFQLTARVASEETRKAGTITHTDLIRVQCGGTPPPPDGQCGEANEFASHVAASTFAGQRNSAFWDLEWTPPATDVGEVIFYAAGNAGNNSGNNQGDIIYTTSTRIQAAVPCNLTERPRITSVRNGASSLIGPLGINTLIRIEGTGFARAGENRTANVLDINEAKYPNTLGCVAVEVGGRRAPVLSVNNIRIDTQVTTLFDQGATPFRVIVNPGTSNELVSDSLITTVRDYSPAFFRLEPTPCIDGRFAETGEITADPALFPNVRAAKIGDELILFATGLGPTEPVYQAGEIPGRSWPVRDPISIEWNGQGVSPSDIVFIGIPAGQISGFYHIRLKVPSFARPGVHNQVRIRTADGILSPEGTTIAVAP